MPKRNNELSTKAYLYAYKIHGKPDNRTRLSPNHVTITIDPYTLRITTDSILGHHSDVAAHTLSITKQVKEGRFLFLIPYRTVDLTISNPKTGEAFYFTNINEAEVDKIIKWHKRIKK